MGFLCSRTDQVCLGEKLRDILLCVRETVLEGQA